MKKQQPIIITGRAAALVSKHTHFDPAKPDQTQVNEFIFVRENCVKDGVLSAFWSGDGYRLIGFAEIKVEVLPIEDMMTAAVESLRAERQNIIATAEANVTRIDGEIQKLLAIDFTPSTN